MKILITGTSGGIGGALANAARSAGHEVLEINRGAFANLASKALGDQTNLDAVVFCTGFCPISSITRMTDIMFEETLHVNCTLFMRLMRHIVANRLYSPGGMRAIAISSVSAKEGWAGGSAYCASKGALSALCRALNAELAAKKISVTALEPERIDTKMYRECGARLAPPDAPPPRSPLSLAHEILDALEA